MAAANAPSVPRTPSKAHKRQRSASSATLEPPHKVARPNDDAVGDGAAASRSPSISPSSRARLDGGLAAALRQLRRTRGEQHAQARQPPVTTSKHDSASLKSDDDRQWYWLGLLQKHSESVMRRLPLFMRPSAPPSPPPAPRQIGRPVVLGARSVRTPGVPNPPPPSKRRPSSPLPDILETGPVDLAPSGKPWKPMPPPPPRSVRRMPPRGLKTNIELVAPVRRTQNASPLGPRPTPAPHTLSAYTVACTPRGKVLRARQVEPDFRLAASLRAWTAGQPALRELTPAQLTDVLHTRNGVRSVYRVAQMTPHEDMMSLDY